MTDMTKSVYFIQFGPRMVKIGFSSNFRRRFANLQAGTTEILTELFVCPGGRDLEQKLHTLFASLRCRNEFFRYNHPLPTFIDMLKQGQVTQAFAFVKEVNQWASNSPSERTAIHWARQMEMRPSEVAKGNIVPMYPESWNNARLEARRRRKLPAPPGRGPRMRATVTVHGR